MVVLTKRRVMVVCEPNWLSGSTMAPRSTTPWKDIADVPATNGTGPRSSSVRAQRSNIDYLSVGSKNAESFLRFGARIRNTAEAARVAQRKPQGSCRWDELERLAELHKRSSTAEEFRAAKAKLLGL